MILKEIIEKLELELCCGAGDLDVDVVGGYTSDLLSDVLANSNEGDLWITLQIHPNIVAIAGMKGLAGVVIINGRKPEKETLDRAEQNGIRILASTMTAFDLSGELHAMGLIGRQVDDGRI